MEEDNYGIKMAIDNVTDKAYRFKYWMGYQNLLSEELYFEYIGKAN